MVRWGAARRTRASTSASGTTAQPRGCVHTADGDEWRHGSFCGHMGGIQKPNHLRTVHSKETIFLEMGALFNFLPPYECVDMIVFPPQFCRFIY